MLTSSGHFSIPADRFCPKYNPPTYRKNSQVLSRSPWGYQALPFHNCCKHADCNSIFPRFHAASNRHPRADHVFSYTFPIPDPFSFSTLNLIIADNPLLTFSGLSAKIEKTVKNRSAGEKIMQNKDTLVLLKKVTLAQRDIQRTDQLLTYLYKIADSKQDLTKQIPNAERYQNIRTEEPLWFIAFGTVISVFLPTLLVVWSYYYMRFGSVEYTQIPGMIGTAVIIAVLCGFIRLFIALFRSLDAKTVSLKKFISATEYTKNLTQNAICRALDTTEIPEHCKELDNLSAIYEYLSHHKNSTIENALAFYEPQSPPEVKPIKPAPAIIYFYLRRTRRNANRLIKLSC